MRRIPFTFFMLVCLAVGALMTNTHFDQLQAYWLDALGFAPQDLWLLRLERLFTSALITYGGWVFWQAIAMTVFAVGLAEWLTGTPRTLLTFWGVHLATLIIESLLIAWPLHYFGWEGAQALALARDVGPSAGYFGCLGLVIAQLPGKWRWLSGGVILVGLSITLFRSLPPSAEAAVSLFSDLAHLIAFPLGWLSAHIGRPSIVIE